MGERDALLATKLHVPRSHDVLVRPRLLKRLEEAASRELLLVSAPAGFGKSTLLAEWARGGGRPVAWVSLDPDDNDPARLWRYLVAAVGQLLPGLEERALPLLHAPDLPALEALVTAVVNELAAAQRELTIVLDDYHVIESRPIHESLALLLERLPPGVHVVIAGRGDPPLPLARMRARDQLAEVRAEDLRFTPDEAVSLMREVWGLDLPAASVLELGDRTEGWVTGLQLAALTLRRGVEPAGLIKGFGGGHRYVLDYLTGEVLERQPDDVRRFLLDTSILERLSGPLCDAVTGRPDGQRMLEDLERANLFLVALDEERRWYRYHRLFADLLHVRLRAEGVERPPRLHRGAAAWFEEHGLIDDAVRHAMAAGDPHLAARLVEGELRRGPAPRRGSDPAALARGPAGRGGALAAAPVGGPGHRRLQRWAAGGGGAAAQGRRAGARRAAGGGARRSRAPERRRERAGEPARGHRVAARRAGLVPRGRRGDRRARVPGPRPPGRRRLRGRPAHRHPLAAGTRGLDAGQPGRGRAGLRRPGRAGAGDRTAAPGPERRRDPRRGAARRRPLGGRPSHLPGRARARQPAGPPTGADRRDRLRRHGRGPLPARPAGRRPAPRRPGHRAVPAAHLHPAAGPGPGHTGLDPAGEGRPGRRAGGDAGGSAGLSEPRRRLAVQPRPGRAGAAAARQP